MPDLPSKFRSWEQPQVATTEEIIKRYNAGYAGALYSPKAAEEFRAGISIATGEEVCSTMGYEESAKNKLVLPVMEVLKAYPGCLPGPGQVTGDCFASGSIVLGEDCKPIEDVQVGDKVYASDGSMTTVISTQVKVHAKPLVKVKALGTYPLTVTEDHNVLVYRLGVVGKGKLVAKALAERHIARFEKGKAARIRNVAKTECETEVVKAYQNRTPELIPAGELRRGDFLLSPLRRDRGAMPDHPLLKTRLGRWAFGYMIGDGWVGSGTAEVTLASHKTRFADRICKAFRAIGLNPKQQGCGKISVFRVRLHATEFCTWLRGQMYQDDKHKRLPTWAIGDRAILAGLLAADGHKTKSSGKGRGTVRTFDSVSPSLAFGVQVSFFALGVDATINKFHRSSGSYHTTKPAYRVQARPFKANTKIWNDGTFMCYPVTGSERIEGPHVVYDVGVAHASHVFLVNGVAASNCVSHSQKNANLVTLVCEAVAGLPDPVSGVVEECPVASPIAIRNGVLSTEAIYAFRSTKPGDGWFCHEAARVSQTKAGCVLRKDYGEINLEKYTKESVSYYDRRSVPPALVNQWDDNIVRDATEIKTFDALRDLLARGFGVSTCGSESWSNTRDENGVCSRTSQGWAHAMAFVGVDDRPWAHETYGGPLVLVMNSWSSYVSGPGKIHGTDLEIPPGSFWSKWRDASRRGMIAMAGVNGWARRQLPDYSPGL